MTDMQGKAIPRLFLCVTMPISTLVQNNPLSEHIDIPGLLLQYIEGVPLTDIATCAPPDRWQSICEEAIRIINLVGDRGILNKDVKTRNFVVQCCAENQFRVFMIDFALCDFREEFTDEVDWETCKATQDEEGAVGYVMQKKLQGGFMYHRSALYRKLDEKYKMDG
ncbi:hypothetical protein N7493_007086 [Penicillium malachiteum]|uniref:Protein kinase domain-containing protein n=1 Tax=Penicillium malachiteum TaxID=1324776 RepID=A0AAD6HIR3_9EURO|nr:hypothetical protein N7493_007086 [Penicillium malachiteum]